MPAHEDSRALAADDARGGAVVSTRALLVKVCGITRLEDAEAAIELGAGALGFIFWPGSPRFIDPYRARRIVSALRPFVTTVGVFVNQPPDYVNGVATLAGLSAVQLHGDENTAYAAAIRRPAIKSVAAAEDGAAWPDRIMLLADVHDPVRRGGTGSKGDWEAARTLARTRPVLLAGGLTADNVADAVAHVQPFGIDVSSGVESAPGIKDPARLAAFFKAVHS